MAKIATAVLSEAGPSPSWLEQPASELWVREAGGEVVAFLAAQRVADELEVLWLGVLPAEQRRGLASALVSVACEGSRTCRLEVRSNNRKGQAFYEHLGFVEVGRRNRYYPSGEDAILLERPLEAHPAG